MSSPTTPTARAALFLGPDAGIEMRDVPIPRLDPGEALARVLCCTLCGSDVHSYVGHRREPAPSVLGHEILGRVEAVEPGPGLASLPDGSPVAPGDEVVWSVAASCGGCARCIAGLPQKCERLFKYGHERAAAGRELTGGLAELCVLRPGTHAVRAPRSLPPTVLAPSSCATATVAGAVRTAGDLADRRVLVVGAGMLGLTACAMARDAGASAVVAADIDPARLERAGDFGATGTIAGGPDGPEPDARDAAPGGWDVVLEFSGSPEAMESAVRLAAVGGRVVLVGATYPSRPIEIDAESVVRRLVRVEGLHNYVPRDLARAVAFLERCAPRHPFAALVERTFPLEETPEAFRWAASARPFRVAIAPNRGSPAVVVGS